MVTEESLLYEMKYDEDANRAIVEFIGFWLRENDVSNLIDDWQNVLNEGNRHTTALFDWTEMKTPPKDVTDLLIPLLKFTNKRTKKMAGIIPVDNSILKLMINRLIREADTVDSYEQFYSNQDANQWLNSDIRPTENVLPKHEAYATGNIDKPAIKSKSSLSHNQSGTETITKTISNVKDDTTGETIVAKKVISEDPTPEDVATRRIKVAEQHKQDTPSFQNPNLRNNPVVAENKNEAQRMDEDKVENYADKTKPLRKETDPKKRKFSNEDK